ncbi:MAG: nuclear transport factor 2 family protein [Deltaproteobacteria bacterium]
MKLSREEIIAALEKWNRAWENYNLDGVIELFHDDILFENWTGARVKGKEALRKAWTPWFTNHGGFRFIAEDLFIDEQEQKVLYRWEFDSPSFEKGYEGKIEKRRGVDVMHFQDGKMVQKLTYSKTTLELDGKRVPLHA